VNDASTDDTDRLLEGFGDAIQVVSHTTNKGFAASCNHGAALAKSDYLVFLNNDTVPQSGWLEALETYMERHPEAAVVGAKLIYPNRTIQHAGVVICQDRYPRHIYSGFPATHPAVSRSRPFQIVTAACMLIRRSAFEELRGFDCDFRNGFEDVDFCLRLGEHGYAVHYCADSLGVHLESVSPGRHSNNRENVSLYRERWGHRVQPDDLRYYVEDGLLRFDYEGTYPLNLEVSPRLCVVETPTRRGAADRLLRERSRRVSELLKENVRLRAELGESAPGSPEIQYQKLRRDIRKAVRELVPAGATILVVSKGDSQLLRHSGRRAWHFPQTRYGAYAGQHPANSAEAITQVEAMRIKGAGYLLIPATSAWWLSYYEGFHEHLLTWYSKLEGPDGLCQIFELNARRRRVFRKSGSRQIKLAKPRLSQSVRS
jgi:glycosyltransferase involved in cell wall biosynthesis